MAIRLAGDRLEVKGELRSARKRANWPRFSRHLARSPECRAETELLGAEPVFLQLVSAAKFP